MCARVCSRSDKDRYHRAVFDSHRLDAPGNAESNQDIKDITANRVGDSHVPQAWAHRHKTKAGKSAQHGWKINEGRKTKKSKESSTLSCDNETGYAVGNTCASSQESYTHNDIWDSKCVSSDCDLHTASHMNEPQLNTYRNSYVTCLQAECRK